MIFVSSWDDGHPLDARVGDLLGRFGLSGTFYVPNRNREGRPVMTKETLRSLASQCEIGSHTRDHTYLDTLGDLEMERQIAEGKQELEQTLGRAVPTFCYPGGRVDRRIKRAVAAAGFASARTVENLRTDAGTDRWMIPTTLQFYPHRRLALMRNFVKRGHLAARAPALLRLTSERDWQAGMRRLLERTAVRGGVFHLWGHSWELEERQLWPALESFLAIVAACAPTARTVSELAKTIEKPA
jgi:peptidoglycan/xylan/chitin deacetylase (PgdA/CDA1 family)